MGKKPREVEELIGEVVEGPGVKVHGPPVVVEGTPPGAFVIEGVGVSAVDTIGAVVAHPVIAPLARQIHVPARSVLVVQAVRELEPRVREGFAFARAVLDELGGMRDALAAVLTPPALPAAPRRRRRKRRRA